MKRIHELSKTKKILLLVVAPLAMAFCLLSLIDAVPRMYVLNWSNVIAWTVLFLVLYLFCLGINAIAFYLFEIGKSLITFFLKKKPVIPTGGEK